MKKSQLMVGKTFIFSLFSLIAVAILIFGYKGIHDLSEKKEAVQLDLFVSSLEKSIEKQTAMPYKSADSVVLSLPKEVESLCLVDGSEEINQLTNTELSAKMQGYETFNLFFMPFEQYFPRKIPNFKIDENPLCISPANGRLKLNLENSGNITKISALNEEDKNADCVSVFYNGEDKIDVVFLNYKYDNTFDFAEDVSSYITEVFSAIEPFSSSINTFNFYRIDEPIGDICSVEDFILCNEFDVKKLASNCPNDYIFILADRNVFTNILSPIRSSAVSNMAKINTADNKFVLMHEFGHIFGKLADEYVEDEYYSQFDFDEQDYPNCDSVQCPEWSGLDAAGCFAGCSLSYYYRPTQTSLMRSLSSEFFGPVNEKVINEQLGVYEND